MRAALAFLASRAPLWTDGDELDMLRQATVAPIKSMQARYDKLAEARAKYKIRRSAADAAPGTLPPTCCNAESLGHGADALVEPIRRRAAGR